MSRRSGGAPGSTPQQLGHPKGEVEGLPAVEAGGAHRLVPTVEIGDLVAAPEAFPDVVARELDVHAARPGTDPVVSPKEAADLGEDVVGVAGGLGPPRGGGGWGGS